MRNDMKIRVRVGGALLVAVGLGFVAMALAAPGALDALSAAVVRGAEPLGRSGRVYAAICGALMLGLGVIQLRMAALAAGTAHPLRALIEGYLAWFVADSVASVALGAPLNVVGNVAFLAVAAGPLLSLVRGATAARGVGTPEPRRA